MRLAVALLAVLVALVAARTSMPTERRLVWPCALAVAINWLWYCAAWLPAPYAPTWAIYEATGARILPSDLWAIADTLCAVWVLSVAWQRVWGVALHVLYITQVVAGVEIDATPSLGAYSDDILTGLFYLQIGCLLVGSRNGLQAQVARGGAMLGRLVLGRSRAVTTLARTRGS
jgi:hypothetical protein